MDNNEFDDTLDLDKRDLDEQDPVRTGSEYPMTPTAGELTPGGAEGSDDLPEGSGFNNDTDDSSGEDNADQQVQK